MSHQSLGESLEIPANVPPQALARARAEIQLAVPPDHVWALVGGFGSLRDWMPYISCLELGEGGRVRHLTTQDGMHITERLLTYDQAGRSYTYTIVQSPISVTNYLSTLRVMEIAAGNWSRVEWFGEFMPDGIGATEATAIFRRIYDDGLKSLCLHYAHPA
jgi:hypothetical protein